MINRIGLGRLLVMLCFVPGSNASAQEEAAERHFPMTVQTEWATLHVDLVLDGLTGPISMVFLPDGRSLLAERGGAGMTLLEEEANHAQTVINLPDIYAEFDAGILDLALHPDFEANGMIYMAYSAGNTDRSTLRLDRFRLDGARMADRETLYELTPWADWEDHWYHYGGRILINEDHLFLTVGDRHARANAQNLSNDIGTLLRLTLDGKAAPGNPFPAAPRVWSYGHRNAQGMALHPGTGQIWIHEHGPLGGDELNVIRRGGNYGWPAISWGKNYDRTPVGAGKTHTEGMLQPVFYWSMNPSGIAPSDMFFASGKLVPGWRGSLFLGAMAKTHLRRLVIEEGRVIHEEEILREELGERVRMARQAPDGTLYVGVDSGQLLRLTVSPSN